MSDHELDYLSPSFDLWTLTVPRIRKILVSHDVQYPSNAKKAQLIELVEQEVLPKRRKIIAAHNRVKRSSKGIEDFSNEDDNQENIADVGVAEEEQLPPPSIRPKSSRSTRSRRSTKGGSAREFDVLIPPNLRPTRSVSKHARTSDTEMGNDPEIRRPARRRTRLSDFVGDVPTIRPEVPAAEIKDEPTDETVFSTDNPFQSGSPAYGARSPSKDHRRRSSRGAMVAREDRRKSSHRRRTDGGALALNHHFKQEDGAIVPTLGTFEGPVGQLKALGAEEVETSEEFTPEEQQGLAMEEAQADQRRVFERGSQPQRKSFATRFAPLAVIISLVAVYASWWIHEKAEVGYCGVGKPSWAVTNPEIPQWAHIIQPSCEPCPSHAYCFAKLDTKCEPNFVVKPHPLSLGGFIPLPPTCEPDNEKARRVRTASDLITQTLRERRTDWECGCLTTSAGKPATSVEITEEELKDTFSGRRRKSMSQEEFDELWKEAIGEVSSKEEILTSTDGNGRRSLSSSSLARIPISCAIRRSIRLTLAKHRIELLGIMILVLCVSVVRRKLATMKEDRARVPLLVSTTLDRLATQASRHAAHLAPEPWISVGQLRDDILRDEFSHKRRERVWGKVKRIVEMNANVRAASREGRSGEWSRVWEWIGTTQEIEGSNHQQKIAGSSSSGSAGALKREPVERKTWEEGRAVY